jgi:hypothetical protein
MKKIIAGLLGLGIALTGLGGVAQAAPAPNPGNIAKPVDTRVGTAVKAAQPPKFLPDGVTLTPARKATDFPDKALVGKVANKVVPRTKAVSTKGSPERVSTLMAGPVFRYATGWDDKGGTDLGTEGVFATVRIGKPALGAPGAGYHTLAEIAAVRPSVNGRQMVEIGWNVDRAVNGSSVEPHLFVFHWVNETAACYNGCGFVDYGPNTVNAGANLGTGGLAHTGTAKHMSILYSGGNWWVSYNNTWVGYFPGSLWSGATPAATFTSMQRVQLFGEAVVEDGNECGTQMGTGTHAHTGGVPNTAAAYFSSGGYTETSGPAPAMDVFTYVTSPTHSGFSTHKVSGRTFYYGGPGQTVGC